MTKLSITTAIAAGLSAAVLGLAAPADAAPSGGNNAQQTISQLEAQGHRVIVKRQSSTPLSEASVVSVRPGQQFNKWEWDLQRDDRILVPAGRIYFVEVR